METNKIPHILIVDDDRDLAEMYKLKFEKQWYKVEVAYDGFSALAIIWEFIPDIIFLDIMMPSMDGFETLSTIRNLAPSLVHSKIIMFTNLNSKEDIEKAMNFWADDFLLKASTTPKQAVEKIKFYLNIHDEEILHDMQHKETQPDVVYCPHCGKNIYEIE